jgi:hypothetical protein
MWGLVVFLEGRWLEEYKQDQELKAAGKPVSKRTKRGNNGTSSIDFRHIYIKMVESLADDRKDSGC